MTQTEMEKMIQDHFVRVVSAEFIDFPATRFIGKEMIEVPGADNNYGFLWKQEEIFADLNGMNEHASFITHDCAFMHRYDQPDIPMHYMVGRFMQANTPVPLGFAYFDIKPCKALFLHIQGEFEDMINQYFDLIHENRPAGYKGTFPKGAYISEVYLPETVNQLGSISKMGVIGFGYEEE